MTDRSDHDADIRGKPDSESGIELVPVVLWIGEEPPPALVRERARVVGPLTPDRVEPLEVNGFTAAVIDVDLGDQVFDVVLVLNEARQPCRSLVIGSQLDPGVVREAFFVGVEACLRKPVAPRVLLNAIRRTSEATLVMRSCLRAVDEGEPAIDAGGLDLTALTPREREIFQLMLDGHTTPRIALTLGLSPRTVKFHASNVLSKLGVDSRLALLVKLNRG